MKFEGVQSANVLYRKRPSGYPIMWGLSTYWTYKKSLVTPLVTASGWNPTCHRRFVQL